MPDELTGAGLCTLEVTDCSGSKCGSEQARSHNGLYVTYKYLMVTNGPYVSEKLFGYTRSL